MRFSPRSIPTPRCLAAAFLLGLLAPGAITAASTELHRTLNRSDPAWRAALAAEQDFSARDERGNTPLHLAALRENLDAVRALLARGADASATNEALATPLHYGCGSEPVVRALLASGAKPDPVSKAGVTPLMGAAAQARSAATVRRLVEAGADVNAIVPGQKIGVLAHAIMGGDRAAIRYLLERGANPKGGEGYLPLVVAAYTGDLETARLLLERGADVNSPNEFFGHALNATFFTGADDVAALLIERGADLNLKSPWGHGTPPMVFAAYNEAGSPYIARLLAARKVNLDSTNDAGESAYSYALKRGPDTPLVRYLKEAGATLPATHARKKAPAPRAIPAGAETRAALIRDSAQRAVDVLQRGSRVFLENGFVREQKCISCHQQTLPAMAFGLARVHGLQVDEHELGRLLHAQMEIMWTPAAESARQMREPFPAAPDDIGFGADALASLQYRADDTTDALGHYLLGTQRAEGWWIAERRPPMQDGPLSATAWAVRAIQLYPPAGEQTKVRDRLQRAQEWLSRQKTATHNEQVFQLLGLAWAGEKAAALQSRAKALLATQRADGGWSQLPALEPDAWAAGSALVALHKAGVAASHEGYRRGVEFLLRTQFEDGSWWVRSRTWPFQPHFDGRFPHGKDQWISAAGTAWAVIALLQTLEPPSAPRMLADGQMLLARYAAKTAGAPASAGGGPAPLATPRAVNFSRDIKPLFERSCASCHDREKPKGNFSVATREGFLKGGQSGDPAIVPGRAADSVLLRYISDQVEDLEMPPLGRREKYPALTPDEIATIRAWIDSGADWQ